MSGFFKFAMYNGSPRLKTCRQQSKKRLLNQQYFIEKIETDYDCHGASQSYYEPCTEAPLPPCHGEI